MQTQFTPDAGDSDGPPDESLAPPHAGSWSNVHIPNRKPDMEYHKVVADLAIEAAPPGGSVIDIGAGLGNVLRLISEVAPGLELHAAEPSPECQKVLREAVPGASLHTISEHHDSLAELGSARFDVGILCHTLEHTTNPLATLHAALETLRPGGSLILAVPNPVSPLVIGFSALRIRHSNEGHMCCWDRSHWMNFLENIAQVEVAKHTQDELRFLPQRLARPIWPLKAIERGLARLLPWWSHSHISVVRARS